MKKFIIPCALALATFASAATTNLPGILSLSGSSSTTNLPGVLSSPTNLNFLNLSNIAEHVTLQAVSNNTLILFTNSITTPGWFTNSEMTKTNGVYAHSGGGFGFVGRQVNIPYRSNFRFVGKFTIGSGGLISGDQISFGFSTNAAGSSPSDQTKFIGFAFEGSSQHFITYRASGGTSYPSSWGTRLWTNGTYIVNFWGDHTNIGCTVDWPGNTNEFRIWIPWANIANTTMSNLVIMWFGTNGQLVNFGGRTNSTEILNTGDNLEGNLNFVQYSPGGAEGRYIRVCVPYNYTPSNPPNLEIVLHGAGGNELNPVYDSSENPAKSPRDYCNYLASNDVIVASIWDPNGNNGQSDSWGTSNSVYCAKLAEQYVRERWVFRNKFYWGESAGGITALNAVASKLGRVAGVILNHAVYSPTNTYSDGINTSGADSAYGGSSLAQLATTTNANGIISGDSRGYGRLPLLGIPIHIQASFGDSVVAVARQTDLLITALGGTPPTSNSVPQFAIFTNTPWTPEISVYEVNGAGATHGDLCWGHDCATNALNFIRRCDAYALQYAVKPFKRPPGIITPNR